MLVEKYQPGISILLIGPKGCAQSLRQRLLGNPRESQETSEQGLVFYGQ